jgi:hypothetical protein
VLMALIIIILIVVFGFKFVGAIVRFCDRNVGFLLVLRWLIGHHYGRTNATFFKPATKVIHPSGRASRWHHKPGYYRMLVRWSIILFIIGSLYGWFNDRLATEIGFLLIALILVMIILFRGNRAVRLASYNRSTLAPLRTAIAEQLNMSDKAAIDSVSLRPDFAKVTDADAHLGTIVLPDNWQSSPSAEDAMRTLLEARIGSNTDVHFRTAKAPFTVEITRTPQPPNIAHLNDYLDVIAALPADKVMLGIDGRAKLVCWDMDLENPHAFTVAPSRMGKTRLLLLLVSQILAQSGSALILDPKRVGVKDVLGAHPRVTIYSDHRDVELMWKAIHEARLLVDERIDAYDNGQRDFKRHIVAVDEISLFSEMSKTAWEAIRESGESKIPPVWADLKAIAYAGAQFKVNLIVFGQAINERILPNMVGQFGTRIMGGYSKRDFERLVGGTPAIPAPKGKGRFLFHDGSQKIFQTLLGSDDELRELAFSGVPDDSVQVVSHNPTVIKGSVIHEADTSRSAV